MTVTQKMLEIEWLRTIILSYDGDKALLELSDSELLIYQGAEWCSVSYSGGASDGRQSAEQQKICANSGGIPSSAG